MIFDKGNSKEDKKYIIKDWDIVTSLQPEEIAKIFGEKTVTCGNDFLVTLVDGIEIATYRKDKADCAEVAHTLQEDVARRDFTINSIAYDPLEEVIIDYNKGVQDILDRKLRFIGDPKKRIEEDPVRLLRGLRFAAKYNLEIESSTYFAMRAMGGLLRNVTGERIQLEIVKAFSCENTYRFLTLLLELKMFNIVFPTLALLEDIHGGIYHAETVLEHCLYAVKAIDEVDNYKLKLACLYHDIGKINFGKHELGHNTFHGHQKSGLDDVEIDLVKRLKFSNDTISYVKFMIARHMDNLDSRKSIRKMFTRIALSPVPLEDFIYLLYADKKANQAHSVSVNFEDFANLHEQCLEILNEQPPIFVTSLAVNGNEVMERFNLKAGVLVGSLLKSAFEKVISEEIKNTKEDIFEYMTIKISEVI
jgi:tRNA nucleotidyltransferase/poly(A) polymerase